MPRGAPSDALPFATQAYQAHHCCSTRHHGHGIDRTPPPAHTPMAPRPPLPLPPPPCPPVPHCCSLRTQARQTLHVGERSGGFQPTPFLRIPCMLEEAEAFAKHMTVFKVSATKYRKHLAGGWVGGHVGWWEAWVMVGHVGGSRAEVPQARATCKLGLGHKAPQAPGRWVDTWVTDRVWVDRPVVALGGWLRPWVTHWSGLVVYRADDSVPFQTGLSQCSAVERMLDVPL